MLRGRALPRAGLAISSLFSCTKAESMASAQSRAAYIEQFVCWLRVHERLLKKSRPPTMLDLTWWRAWLHTALDSRGGPTPLETFTSKLIQVLLQG
jgi:hypothetical protein